MLALHSAGSYFETCLENVMKYFYSAWFSLSFCFMITCVYTFCSGIVFQSIYRYKEVIKTKYNSTVTQHNVGHTSLHFTSVRVNALFLPSSLSSTSVPSPFLSSILHHPPLHPTSPSFLYSLISLFTHLNMSVNFLPSSVPARAGLVMRENHNLTNNFIKQLMGV